MHPKNRLLSYSIRVKFKLNNGPCRLRIGHMKKLDRKKCMRYCAIVSRIMACYSARSGDGVLQTSDASTEISFVVTWGCKQKCTSQSFRNRLLVKQCRWALYIYKTLCLIRTSAIGSIRLLRTFGVNGRVSVCKNWYKYSSCKHP